MCADLRSAFYLGFVIANRNILSLYRQSFLGMAWAFLPPLLMALTFHYASNANVLSTSNIKMPYALFVILGTASWQIFAEAVTIPLKNLAQFKSMISKINFPREALIISAIIECFFNFLIKSVLFAAVLLYYGVSPSLSIMIVPFLVFFLILGGSLIGLLFSPFSLLYNDVGRAVPIALGFWMMITPIVYLKPSSGAFSTIVSINPVTPFIMGIRELLTGSPLTMSTQLLSVSFFTLVFSILVWIVFRVSFPYAVERVSA
jgi:lipopolysaccharide transport system permease protein